MPHSVQFKNRQVEHDYRSIHSSANAATRRHLEAALARLALNPWPIISNPGSHDVVGKLSHARNPEDGEWRIEAGHDHRMRYRIDDDGLVTITKVRHRSDIYSDL